MAEYVMTPARVAALRKAQLASAAARRARKNARISSYVPKKARPLGLKGLKANFTPYVRVNKRSQTAGFNTGTGIPKTHRRISAGAYVRLEGTRRNTAVDRFVDKQTAKVFPKGTKRGKVAASVKSNVVVHGPVVRGSVKGHQVRLGTSRGAGPTVIVRRGKHKTPRAKSIKGVRSYDNRMRKIAGQKAAMSKSPRPQRRKAAKKSKSI
jgi:hypothetical protein